MTLTNILLNADSIGVYKNGRQIEVTLDTIRDELNNMLDKAYFCPAFAVVRNQDVIEKINSDLWIEFRYNEVKEFAEMPFERLLIKIEPKMLGFNLMRYYNGIYDGRCFYLNLFNDTTKFYNFLQQLA